MVWQGVHFSILYIFSKYFLNKSFWKCLLFWEASLAQIIAGKALFKTEKMGISKVIHTFGKQWMLNFTESSWYYFASFSVPEHHNLHENKAERKILSHFSFASSETERGGETIFPATLRSYCHFCIILIIISQSGGQMSSVDTYELLGFKYKPLSKNI